MALTGTQYPLRALPFYIGRETGASLASHIQGGGEGGGVWAFGDPDQSDGQLQNYLAQGYFTTVQTETGSEDSGIIPTEAYALAKTPPPAKFPWQGVIHTVPWGKFAIWDSTLSDYGFYLRNPALTATDPNYGLITLQVNVGWKPTLYDKVSDAITAIALKQLEGLATGGILSVAGGLIETGASMDEFDFLSDGDILTNNAPGFMDGATDPFGDATSISFDDTGTVDSQINDMLNNTDAPAFDPDTNNQGVMDALGTGQNTVGDSASLTDEPGAPSNNNGVAPRGGGVSVPGATSNKPATLVASPSAAQPLTMPIPYLPPNPRTLVNSPYNPQGGGLYPVYNPAGNVGSIAPGGTGPARVPTSTVQPPLANNPTMWLLLGGVILLALVIK